MSISGSYSSGSTYPLSLETDLDEQDISFYTENAENELEQFYLASAENEYDAYLLELLNKNLYNLKWFFDHLLNNIFIKYIIWGFYYLKIFLILALKIFAQIN